MERDELGEAKCDLVRHVDCRWVNDSDMSHGCDMIGRNKRTAVTFLVHFRWLVCLVWGVCMCVCVWERERERESPGPLRQYINWRVLNSRRRQTVYAVAAPEYSCPNIAGEYSINEILGLRSPNCLSPTDHHDVWRHSHHSGSGADLQRCWIPAGLIERVHGCCGGPT